MSLQDRAAKKAQEEGAAARQAAAKRREEFIQKLEEHVSMHTGLTATFVDTVDVAHEAYAPTTAFDRTSRKMVAKVKCWRLRVDDVDVIAEPKTATVHHEQGVGKYDFYFLFTDPDHGLYRLEFSSLSWWRQDENKSPEELTDKFVADLAAAKQKRPEHPAVKLTRDGESCPTCGRSYL